MTFIDQIDRACPRCDVTYAVTEEPHVCADPGTMQLCGECAELRWPFELSPVTDGRRPPWLRCDTCRSRDAEREWAALRAEGLSEAELRSRSGAA
jgi:hypothetical protein